MIRPDPGALSAPGSEFRAGMESLTYRNGKGQGSFHELCPHDPAGLDRPGGAEIPALEAPDAGGVVNRLRDLVIHAKHAHGTLVHARPASGTHRRIDIDLDE